MVNLPGPNEQAVRVNGERDSVPKPRSHHNWGARLGKHKDEARSEPKGLGQLDKLAKRTVELMEKYAPKSEDNYHKAMDLLRLQYNLNFIVLCEDCHGPHAIDEILAPER